MDAKNGEMTLLVGEKNMNFDLHQSKPLTDEEMRAFMKLKSLFRLIKEEVVAPLSGSTRLADSN